MNLQRKIELFKEVKCHGARRMLLIGVIASVLIGQAQAAGLGSGLITYFVPFDINGQEAFVVRLDSMTSTPACTTANRFVMSAANPKFKIYLATMLGAVLSSAPLTVQGTGSCTTYGGSEDISYICLGDDPC